MDKKELINFLLNDVCDAVRTVSDKYFRSKVLVDELKPDSSLVSIADRQIESEVFSLLENKCRFNGGISIIGEEFGTKIIDNSRYCMVIDPIDGTSSFLCGRPTFCTLISIFDGDTLCVSLCFQPFTNEKIIAYDGMAFFNGVKISTSKTTSISGSKLATTGPQYFAKSELEMFFMFSKSVKATIYGGDAYLYFLLSMGFVDVVMESGLNIYDVLPLIHIIKCAGGDARSFYTGQDYTSNAFLSRQNVTELSNKKIKLDIIASSNYILGSEVFNFLGSFL